MSMTRQRPILAWLHLIMAVGLLGGIAGGCDMVADASLQENQQGPAINETTVPAERDRNQDADDNNDDDELRSPITKALDQWLGEHKDDGTSEERKLIRKTLRERDEELSRSLGKENLMRQIWRANTKPRIPCVRHPKEERDRKKAINQTLKQDRERQDTKEMPDVIEDE